MLEILTRKIDRTFKGQTLNEVEALTVLDPAKLYELADCTVYHDGEASWQGIYHYYFFDSKTHSNEIMLNTADAIEAMQYRAKYQAEKVCDKVCDADPEIKAISVPTEFGGAKAYTQEELMFFKNLLKK